MLRNILINIITFIGLAISLFTIGSCSSGQARVSREIYDSRVPASDIQTIDPEYIPEPKVEKAFRFEWPVEDARMTRGFLPSKRRPHWGIDLAAPKGSSIYAAQSGMVIYAGRDFRGFGKMVLIESGTGWATLYAHLDKILVNEGQNVTVNDILGLMGRTGKVTGVHLHFEIRKDKGPVDPLDYLPGGHKLAHK